VIGDSNFLMMPSASAASWPKPTASMNSSNTTTTSIQLQAGARGISSAVMIPVVP
jgi:hypothetical protein